MPFFRWFASLYRLSENQERLDQLCDDMRQLRLELHSLQMITDSSKMKKPMLQLRHNDCNSKELTHSPSQSLTPQLHDEAPRMDAFKDDELHRSVTDGALSGLAQVPWISRSTPVNKGAFSRPREFELGQSELWDDILTKQETDLLDEWKSAKHAILAQRSASPLSEDFEILRERRENAVWRLWHKAHKEALSETKNMSFFEHARALPKRTIEIFGTGVCIGVVVVMMLLPLFVYLGPPRSLVETEAAQTLVWLLNTTLNQTMSSEPLPPDPSLPALQLAEEGLAPKHPVLLVPGLVSTGLEVWQAAECLGGRNAYFRHRLWGSSSMITSAVRNASCWLEHLRLDPETGLDPPNVKLRPASGFESTDYLVPGYWVWAKVLENLGTLGYDGNSMAMMPYDWRLSFELMERRDRYFSHLQLQAEMLHETMGEKVVVLAHSMGANLWLAFMRWVTTAGRNGMGEPDWVDHHIHSFVDLGGPLLGAMGPLTALLSGEAHMGPLGVLTDKLMDTVLGEAGRIKVRNVFRTWGGMHELLPTGGDAVWGSQDEPTDCKCDLITTDDHTPLGVNESLRLMQNLSQRSQQCSLTKDGGVCSGSSWNMFVPTGPLDTSLPEAPDLKIFCMYGVRLDTERAYHFSVSPDDDTDWHIDYKRHGTTPAYAHGAYYTTPMEYGKQSVDGDGTVPLVSLGYMCQEGWRKLKALNPGDSETVVREYIDESVGVMRDSRGGPKAAKHVEMLGNYELLVDILHLVSGNGSHLLRDRVHSRIPEVARRVTKRLLTSQPELAVARAQGRAWQ